MPRLEKDPAFDMPVPLQIAELTDTLKGIGAHGHKIFKTNGNAHCAGDGTSKPKDAGVLEIPQRTVVGSVVIKGVLCEIIHNHKGNPAPVNHLDTEFQFQTGALPISYRPLKIR
jgi:hypothetical protein